MIVCKAILNLKANQEFIAKFDCRLPWMTPYNDTNICPIIEEVKEGNETTYHTLSQKVDIWEDMKNAAIYYEKCPSGTKCNRPIYNSKMEVKSNPIYSTKAEVKIQLENPSVQNIKDSYAYDSQSLIGEVGGTLGLFLGLSTYSLVEFFTCFMEKLFCRQK